MNVNRSHAEFEELCALANTGVLTDAERLELVRHLAVCPECFEAHRQYMLLATAGIPLLASMHADPVEFKDWDEKSARRRLLARIGGLKKKLPQKSGPHGAAVLGFRRWASFAANSRLRVAVAACIVASVGYGISLIGTRRKPVHNSTITSPGAQRLAEQGDETLKRVLASQAERIALLQAQNSARQAEVDRLGSELKHLQQRAFELASTNEKSEDEVRAAIAQRGAVAAQLAEVQQAYADAQKELAAAKSERDRVLLRVASLESSLQEMRSADHEQEQRLRDDEQYLAADRDIRELMGARKLYIADVFDVDSGSRTRKPFGRVFYTENKSLIFYAFDLDREPRVKNATFQVWGEKDAAQGEKPRPLNLGILYMDSESNRRWVLRSDDATQLAEIDAVFVTVEPHGGSVKPTSKPFLYALLRKEANHP
jgi:hypothetical protein